MELYTLWKLETSPRTRMFTLEKIGHWPVCMSIVRKTGGRDLVGEIDTALG